MENSAALPARGGKSFDASLIVPNTYLQFDKAWADERMGETEDRLADYGCTVCAVAMALEVIGGEDFNPSELNSFLNKREGYTDRAWLIWASLENLDHLSVSVDVPSSFNHDDIDKHLLNGVPVIAKLKLRELIIHWVLIVGKEGQDYLAKDPLDPNKGLVKVADLSSKIYSIRAISLKE